MPPKRSRGGRVSQGGQAGPAISLRIRITGVDSTTADFKAIRRKIDDALRDTMAKVGERTVIPVIKAKMPRKDASDKQGLPVGTMAGAIAVKRDRLDVVIKSTLPARLDRALGWIDFGGQRPRDTKVRVGPHVIVGTLDAKSATIEQQVYDEIMDQFRHLNFDVSR